jgi:hypothetical protein
MRSSAELHPADLVLKPSAQLTLPAASSPFQTGQTRLRGFRNRSDKTLSALAEFVLQVLNADSKLTIDILFIIKRKEKK